MRVAKRLRRYSVELESRRKPHLASLAKILPHLLSATDLAHKQYLVCCYLERGLHMRICNAISCEKIHSYSPVTWPDCGFLPENLIHLNRVFRNILRNGTIGPTSIFEAVLFQFGKSYFMSQYMYDHSFQIE